MGNNQSTAEVKNISDTKTSKRRAKDKSKSKTVKPSEQPSPNKTPDTTPSYKVNTMFPPQVLAGIVGRQRGWKFVVPFTVLMCDWTKEEWPYTGSFEKEKLELAEANVNLTGNPAWDSKYVRECMNVWAEVARKRCGVTLEGQDCEWVSHELKEVLEMGSRHVAVSDIPMYRSHI